MQGKHNKHVLLCVTGGIAAYKACEVLRALQKKGYEVRVCMTLAATRFVAPLTFEALTRKPVFVDQFSDIDPVAHITLADWADVICVVPASANTLAKITYGIADNLVTSTLLAATTPVVMAPAMNCHMWENIATQTNLDLLRTRGFVLVYPQSGDLACGYKGMGHLADISDIVASIDQQLIKHAECKQDLKSCKVLITAGPTREYLDPVRYISNPSTGKMGFALAEVCADRGAEVYLVSGPVALTTSNPHIHRIDCMTAQDMLDICLKYFSDTDIFVGTAAIGDFVPKDYSEHKIKKTDSDIYTFCFTKSCDVIKELASKKASGQTVVGFAAETNDITQNALKKLSAKNLDLIAVNDISKSDSTFGSDTNKVTVYTAKGEHIDLPLDSKENVAKSLVDCIVDYRRSLLA